MALRVQADGEPPVDYLPGGSTISDDEDPYEILSVVIQRIKRSNRIEPSRSKSMAVQRCEEGLWWLHALREGLAR